jgi:hypothetical protein
VDSVVLLRLVVLAAVEQLLEEKGIITREEWEQRIKKRLGQ